MEAIVLAFIVTAVMAGLLAFDMLALRFGADSRRGIGDDHQRPLGA
jgi:hypothetical protein